MRVDPRTGAATKRTWLPSDVVQFRVNGLAVGGGFVWASDEDAGTLYRVDPATGAVRVRELGSYILRPVFGFGRVWACVATSRGASMMRIHPLTLRDTLVGKGLPAEEGDYVVGYGSAWRHDVPSGTLMRFDPRTGDLAGLVRVKQTDGPAQAGLQVTSMATGADGVWLTIA
jgi:virginiamycin B lyase